MKSHTGSWQLHYQRFLKLAKLGVFRGEFEQVGKDYVAARNGLSRLLIDATHVKARKGGPCIGPSPVDRGKSGSKMTVLTDDQSVPICAVFCPGNEADTVHLPNILDKAERIHGNSAPFSELLADDSMANRLACIRKGLRPLILQRRRRVVNPRTTPRRNQRAARTTPGVVEDTMVLPMTDEETARTNRYRWAVERCFAWQKNFRRVERRLERLLCTFQSMQYVSLSCIVRSKLEKLGVQN